MSTLTHKQFIRMVALRSITQILGTVENGTGGLEFSVFSNRFIDDKEKLAIRTEIFEIRQQLARRLDKLEQKLVK